MAPHGLTEEHYLAVESWRTRPDLYDDRQRLAIELAEKYAVDHLSLDDEFFARLRQSFTDPEIIELIGCCGNWLGFGRMLAVLGVHQSCALRL